MVPVFVVGGYFGQRLLLQRSLDSGPITTLLVTFRPSVVLENVLLEVFSANNQSLNIGSLVSGSVQISSQVDLPYLSMIFLGTAVVALGAVHLFLARTRPAAWCGQWPTTGRPPNWWELITATSSESRRRWPQGPWR